MKHWETTLLAFTLVLLTLTLNAQTWLTNGLAGYYPFNGNAADESGNGNGATAYGGAVPGTNRLNQANNGYRLTAKPQYLKTTNYTGFPVSTNDFAVSLWLKLERLMTTDHTILFANHLIDNFQLGITMFNDSGATFQFYTGNAMVCESLRMPLQSNTWYHVAIVRQQNVITLFLNGENVGQNTTTLGNNATDWQRILDFGLRSSSNSHQLYGQLDDIRVYNRALSSGEVAQLYRLDDPTSIGVKWAVYLDSSTMKPGFNYQIQTSTNLIDWADYGPVFTATNSVWESPDVWKVDRSTQKYFRLQQL